MSKKKKKDFSKPRRVKRDPEAGMPRPKPIRLVGPREELEQAREYPFLGSWVMSDWEESGLTPIIVARQAPDGQVFYASILVDTFCLGVKDAFWRTNVPLKRFQEDLPEALHDEAEEIDIDLAHELIYGAVEFASRYGFEPHPDFKLASLLLEPPEMHPPSKNLKFGKDGKPFFIAGPNDNAGQIIARLERTAGPGNFEVMLGFSGIEDL